MTVNTAEQIEKTVKHKPTTDKKPRRRLEFKDRVAALDRKIARARLNVTKLEGRRESMIQETTAKAQAILDQINGS